MTFFAQNIFLNFFGLFKPKICKEGGFFWTYPVQKTFFTHTNVQQRVLFNLDAYTLNL